MNLASRVASALALLLALSIGRPARADGHDPATIVGPPAGVPLVGAALESCTSGASHLLRCPVCQSMSVEASSSESSRAMRKEVEALCGLGYDQEQILDYFEASYGPFIRLEPKAEGFSLWVWVLPVIFLVVGGFFLVGTLRRRAVPAVAPDPSLDPYLARVRAEVEDSRG